MLGLGIAAPSESVRTHEIVFQDLFGVEFAFAVVSAGLFAGIGEELLFRGYIQTRLCDRWGVKWGILWTSLLFGLTHWDPPRIVLATCFGAYQGVLTQRTKSVIPAIVCHSASNILLDMISVEGFRRLYAMNLLLIGVLFFMIFASVRRISRIVS